MSMDYEAIKALAKERGVRVPDLCAMSTNHDPFYMGAPADRAAAEWFADVWRRFSFTSGVHLRRIHYRLVSQREPLYLWFDHKPYENTLNCWTNLMEAAGQARYLKLVDFDAFIDQRNPDPLLFLPSPPEPVWMNYVDEPPGPLDTSTPSLPSLLYSGYLWMPSLPARPSVQVLNFTRQQRYHLEIWAEKSTMNDVLMSVCARYNVNLMTASGELSITQVHKAAQRIIASGKPTRILYLSRRGRPCPCPRRASWNGSCRAPTAPSPLSSPAPISGCAQSS